jgi:hypothetical protein
VSSWGLECQRQWPYFRLGFGEGSSRKEGKEPAKRVRAGRRCGCYSKIRHNSRTCKVEIKDANNSKNYDCSFKERFRATVRRGCS